MNLRLATEDEIDQIADLLTAAYDEYAPPPGDAMERTWAGYRAEVRDVKSRWPISEHLVVEESGRLVATATFFPDASIPETGDDAWPAGFAAMRLLGVHPDARGAGHGRLLTQECIRRAEGLGRRWFGLHTTRLMDRARGMYERMGFLRFPMRDIPVLPDFVVVAYRLALAPGIVVRDARPDELDRVAAVMVDAYRQYAPDVPPDIWAPYEEEIRDVRRRLSHSDLIVAERAADGEIMGAVTFYRDATLSEHEGWPAGYAEMRLLAVPERARGLGLGHVLAQECVARARRNGNPHIGLHTSYLMKVAEGMYQRMGFSRAPEFDFKPAPDSDITALAYCLSL